MLSQSDGPQAEAGKEEAGLNPMTRVVKLEPPNLDCAWTTCPGASAATLRPRKTEAARSWLKFLHSKRDR